MQKKSDDKQWAWHGKESPFQKKLADLRQDANNIQQSKKTIPKVDPLSLLQGARDSISKTSPEEIEKAALLDAQTGFLNSRQFMRKLKHEIKRAARYKHPVALCFITVDGLKEVKRLHGVQSANVLLKLAGDTIQEVIRTVDIPARYSADILVVIMPETSDISVQSPAERIRQQIKNKVTNFGGEDVFITASIGCSSFPSKARDANELIAKATQALEVAEQKGGDILITI